VGASRSSSPAIPTNGGEGKAAEVDGGNFGGYVKPANVKHIAVIAIWQGDRPLANCGSAGFFARIHF
jgi:hypothetical protein